MPLIPSLPGSNALPNLPGPVLDRERRPTVDNSGVGAAAVNLAKSGRMPEVPMELAKNGLGAIGAAISNAGDTVSAVAQAHARNQDKIAVYKAETRMQQALADFEIDREKNPDPSKYLEIYDGHAKKAQAEIFGEGNKLSPAAREEVALKWERFNAAAGRNVSLASIKETSEMAKRVNLDGVKLAKEEQNPERLEAELHDAVKNLRMTESEAKLHRADFKDVGERKQKEAEARAYTTAENVAIKFASGVGEDEAIQRVDGGMFGDLPERDKERLRNKVKEVAHDRRGEALESLANGIVSGSLNSEAAIDAAYAKNPHVNAVTIDKAKQFLHDRDELSERLDQNNNGPFNSVELLQKIKDYDPSKDRVKGKEGLQFFTLQQEIGKKVPQGMRDDLYGPLAAKWTGKLPPPPTTSKEFVKSILDDTYDPIHGAKPWRTKQFKEIWEPNEKTGKQEKHFREVTVDNPEARAAAHEAKARAATKVYDWLDANPNAPIEEVKKRIMQAIPEGDRKNNLEALKGSKPTAAVRQFAPSQDLGMKLPPPMREHAGDFIEAGQTYGINPKVLAAISAFETGGGTSRAFREFNNAMGISNSKGPTAQTSVRDSIFHMAKLLGSDSGPYAKANTIEELGAIYSPPGAENDRHGTNAEWPSGVRSWLARL